MKNLTISWGVVTMIAVMIKLFTYEFYLEDDPTTGIALRDYPALVSRQILVETLSDSDYILIQDENSFIGEGLYRALITWGWITLLTVWLLLLAMIYRISQDSREVMRRNDK
ncbi:MAG: hypothetical protein PVI97_13420 [Candidatus Thiodiazotropha sp.]|jgi:hypothetical protein